MADITANTITVAEQGNFATRALTGFWNFLIRVGENSARARALQELSQISDEEFERRGTTRVEVVRRMFSDF